MMGLKMSLRCRQSFSKYLAVRLFAVSVCHVLRHHIVFTAAASSQRLRFHNGCRRDGCKWFRWTPFVTVAIYQSVSAMISLPDAERSACMTSGAISIVQVWTEPSHITTCAARWKPYGFRRLSMLIPSPLNDPNSAVAQAPSERSSSMSADSRPSSFGLPACSITNAVLLRPSRTATNEDRT